MTRAKNKLKTGQPEYVTYVAEKYYILFVFRAFLALAVMTLTY